MLNPFRQIFNIHREELPQALLMFAYFFLVITNFSILKPLKSGLFIEFYDQGGLGLAGWQLAAAQVELLAKVSNMFVALGAATAFVLLSQTFRRQHLSYIFCLFVILGYGLFTLSVESPGHFGVWSFYLFGDLYSTLMVATFFAFLNDSVSPGQAKRLYGLIVFGGVAGGAFGGTVARAQIQAFSMTEWLLVFILINVAIMGIAAAAGRLFSQNPPPQQEEEDVSEGGGGVMAGARMVLSSSYLLSIVAIVGLYEMVSTIMDFQFKSAISHYLDGAAIRVHIATVAAISNWISFLVQVFFTSLIMTRVGVGAALLVLPGMALAGSLGFLASPVLLLGSALYICDNGFNNSMNQSAREVLYVPTSRRAKYQAKAVIDMFIQRFAKALGVGMSLLITTFLVGYGGVRWLSLLAVAILVLWIWIARYAGRQFNQLSSPPPGSSGASAQPLAGPALQT